MDRMNRQMLQDIARVRDFPCLSLFLPIHRARAEIHQDKLRLKNLLKEADRELREKAWNIVQPRVEYQVENALRYYNNLRGLGRVSSDVRRIVNAAFDGRIEVLFLSDERHVPPHDASKYLCRALCWPKRRSD